MLTGITGSYWRKNADAFYCFHTLRSHLKFDHTFTRDFYQRGNNFYSSTFFSKSRFNKSDRKIQLPFERQYNPHLVISLPVCHNFSYRFSRVSISIFQNKKINLKPELFVKSKLQLFSNLKNYSSTGPSISFHHLLQLAYQLENKKGFHYLCHFYREHI